MKKDNQKKLLCEEIKSRSLYPLTPSQCVEKDKDGKCLMSMQWVMIDMSIELKSNKYGIPKD